MLRVPVPQLDYEALAPNVAAAELPLTVLIGPVKDGEAPQTPVELSRFALVGYRRLAPGSPTEVWDHRSGEWVAEGGPVAAEQLAYADDQPDPWRATLVAGGGERFVVGAGGYPAYSFRGLFAVDGGDTALSGPSTAVSFGRLADRNLMVLGPGDGERPDNATEARLQLRNAAFQVIGGLVVRRSTPGAEVVVSNAGGAAVVLRPDGSIELLPAPGRRVTITADLETERILYRPGGGGGKQTLA